MRLLLLAILTLLPGFAWAEKRAALVIGNDAYSDVPALAKAVADARAVAGRLEDAGFETVLATDVGRRDMNLAIARFTNMLNAGDTAFVFFAGHGVEITGENYLLPTDILAPSDGERDLVMSESIGLSDLLDRVRRTGARTTIAIIDACRNNPFEAATGRSIGRTRGLGRIAAPEGTFVVYSAGAGQLALDGLNEADPDDNSVFTRLLLPKLDQPGLELRSLVADLRVEVRDLAKTQNHAQFPAYYDELLGDFYFRSGRGLEPIDVATAPQALDRIRDDFRFARDLGTVAAMETFLATYGHTQDFTVDLARTILDQLRGAPQGEGQSRSGEETAAVAAPVQPEEPARDPAAERREIIRESQRELARLGCAPGGADGVLGPRSRAAFGDFVTQTGSSLSQDALGTQRALDVLRSTAAPACRQTTVAAAPQTDTTQTRETAPTGLDISGTWSYSFLCVVVPGSGSVTMRRTGPNTFAGAFRDSLAQTGSMAVTLDGLAYRSRIVSGNGLVVHETGRFSADGTTYTSTSHSVGCAVKGRRV